MHVLPVAGGHREDETAGRPSSWTWVIGGPLGQGVITPSCPWNIHSAYRSHGGSCLPEHGHERAVSGWIQLRPPIRFDVSMYGGLRGSCRNHSKPHMSYVSSISSETLHLPVWTGSLYSVSLCLLCGDQSDHKPTPFSFCLWDSDSVISLVLISLVPWISLLRKIYRWFWWPVWFTGDLS